MPLHFPGMGSHSRSNSRSEEPPSFIPTSPRSQLSIPSRSTTMSSTSSDSQPPSILKKMSSSHRPSFETNDSSSASGSVLLTKRMSNLSFDRTDTLSSMPDTDNEDGLAFSSPSTPATSVSSLGAQCPLPASSATERFPFFVLALSSTSTLSFLALPTAMRPGVVEALNRAWKKGISKMGEVAYREELMKKHKEKGCDGAVWEVTLKGDAWNPSSQDKVSSKRILLYLMAEFARAGFSLTSSFRTSTKDSGKDTLVFLRGEPDPEPVFFAVAFHSSDRIWIIDADSEVGQTLEESIKTWWTDGIQGARTRERHCREIRLRGNPWSAHSTSALISARCIHLVIMKSITFCSKGYDFVGSVDMCDLEEGEMPLTIYRRKW